MKMCPNAFLPAKVFKALNPLEIAKDFQILAKWWKFAKSGHTEQGTDIFISFQNNKRYMGKYPPITKVSLYKVARTQRRDFCWIHSFKSFVENLGLCGVYFYYMSEYPFNKYYMCF